MSVLDVEAEEDTCEYDADSGEDGHDEEERDGDHPGNNHLQDRVRWRIPVCNNTKNMPIIQKRN